ncbi:hypothetical protein KIH39_24845 [Telmatocola sphagniphila]|uniref:Uncharacterized protein n=1 Tax=Telmatocola sphagniphila TaxID=1123043 RepID=A0A8E6B4J1_9BACT|nr:hypothetical protein [Telmatocola sphagniphila]QVL32025.1 hypothetical protein KIH39_24845 [Telmatocola sphagniphila]
MRIRLPQNRVNRYTIYLAIAILLYFVGIILYRAKITHDSARELEEITSRLDREDPGWRWEDFLTNRARLPDEDNSYFLLQKICNLPSPASTNGQVNISEWRTLPEGMPADFADSIAQLLADNPERISLARKLENFPEGRHQIDPVAMINSDFKLAQKIRGVGIELLWDVWIHSQIHQFDVCVQDIRAIRNTARSCSEDGLIPFLVRNSIDFLACNATQQMISQGEIKSSSLELLQKEILKEIRDLNLKKAIRMERARNLKAMEFLLNRPEALSEKLEEAISTSQEGKEITVSVKKLVHLLSWRYPLYAKADQAFMLRMMTEQIDNLDKPPRELFDYVEKQAKEISDLEQSPVQARNALSRTMVFRLFAVRGDYRCRGTLRATACGLGAERFRIVNKRWPNNLEELVPKFLEKVEEDPFTGKPLLFKRLNDGIVIYSVGQDLKDDGGDVLGVVTDSSKRGAYKSNLPTDIGFRLWDVNKRGK